MNYIIDNERFNQILANPDTLKQHDFQICDSVYFSKPLVEIPPYFFSQCKNIVKVWLPKTIKKISNNAFSSCSNLTQLINLEVVEAVEEEAFAHCSSLKAVCFSDNLKTLKDGAFFDCCSLEAIDLGKQLKHIPDYCFYDDVKLRSIMTAATTIGNNAFVRAGLDAYDFSNVQTIGDFAFKLARNLEHIYLPASVQHIGIGCFHRCYSLLSAEIDANVAYLSERMFKAALNLKTAIVTNQQIKCLADEVFDDCYSLSSISFANKDIMIRSFNT